VRDNGSSRANGANGANRGATAHEAPGPAGTSRAPASDQIAGKLGVDTVSGNYFNHKSDGGNQRYVAATVVSEK